MLLIMTIITGVAYPLVITAVAQLIYPDQANGSLIQSDGKSVGSALIGQKFTDPKYFWSRPSGVDYNPMPSSGTNLGPTSSVLRDSVVARTAKLRTGTNATDPIPADLLFASGSGLDPEISPEAARFQVDRIASARQLDQAQRTALLSLVERYTETPSLGIFGQLRVNVLKLNLALDSLGKK
jgi:K+-transporting ATPase ATPase C chain